MSPVGSPTVPYTDVSLSQSGHRVAARSDGGWVVAWNYQNTSVLGSRDVIARVFDENGLPLGTEFGLSTFNDGNQDLMDIIATSDGGFIAIWTSYGQVEEFQRTLVFRKFDALGEPVGPEQPRLSGPT